MWHGPADVLVVVVSGGGRCLAFSSRRRRGARRVPPHASVARPARGDGPLIETATTIGRPPCGSGNGPSRATRRSSSRLLSEMLKDAGFEIRPVAGMPAAHRRYGQGSRRCHPGRVRRIAGISNGPPRREPRPDAEYGHAAGITCSAWRRLRRPWPWPSRSAAIQERSGSTPAPPRKGSSQGVYGARRAV